MKWTEVNILLMLVLAFSIQPLNGQPIIGLVEFSSGFTKPVDIVNAGDGRLFVVEQAGRIYILNELGTKNTQPFLDIVDRVRSTGNEQGLLGLAFHPDYANNGLFYVNYTRSNGNSRVSRFSVSTTNADSAVSISEMTLLTVQQPYGNHNGGDLHFGPDGYLYVALGDGGSGGDPLENAQNPESLLGKILRIDVDAGSPYAVPPDNPFISNPDTLDEIWAMGLRNPWRFSFDRLTGDLWIGDVGQNSREEIDFQAGSSEGGENYGWDCYEGNVVYENSGCGPIEQYVLPVHVYNHSNNKCSVTGGYVYRGEQYPNLHGYYLFADYCTGSIWTLHGSQGNWESTYHGDFFSYEFSSFGEDVDGELYLAGLSTGKIYQIRDLGIVAGILVEQQLICADSCTQLTASVTGGTPPYSYQWSHGLSNDPGPHTVCIGSTTEYSLKVVDNAGLKDSLTVIVTVDDTLAPVPDLGDLPVITAECSAMITAPTATDNCSGSILANTADPQNYTAPGTYSIQWNYADSYGNTSTQDQTVVVEDTNAPVPDTPNLPNIVAQCSAEISVPTATDDCEGQIQATTKDPHVYTLPGTYMVHWSYDDGHGNISGQNQMVIIEDTTPPQPVMDSLEMISDICSVQLNAPSAIDNCSGQINGTTTDPINYTQPGTYIVHWEFEDNNNNLATQQQIVEIIDTIAPVPEMDSLPAVAGECYLEVGAPLAFDDCSGLIEGTTTDSIRFAQPGTYIVHWHYEDGNGNKSTQEQMVDVADSVAPLPQMVSLPEVIGDCGAEVSTIPLASDNCNGEIQGSTSDPLNYSNPGNYTIHWDYNDGNGNTSSQEQTVVVRGIDTTVGHDGIKLAALNPDVAYQWIDCDDGILIGETNQDFTPSDNGRYAVILNNGECSDTSSCHLVVISGIDKGGTDSEFAIFPNPTDGLVNFALDFTYAEPGLRIHDIYGRQVFSGKIPASRNFDLSDQPNGLYLVRVQTGDRVSMKRLLKR